MCMACIAAAISLSNSDVASVDVFVHTLNMFENMFRCFSAVHTHTDADTEALTVRCGERCSNDCFSLFRPQKDDANETALVYACENDSHKSIVFNWKIKR